MIGNAGGGLIDLNHSGGRGSSSAACTDGKGIPVSAGDAQCPHGCGGN